MHFTEFLRLARQVKKKNSDAHVIAKKDADGFNKFHLNYIQDKIHSIEIRIRNADPTKEHYLNVDGEEQKIEHPQMPILVQVLPKATNVLYIPESAPLPQENLRMFYDRRLMLPDFEL
jgi:hypothetical protein